MSGILIRKEIVAPGTYYTDNGPCTFSKGDVRGFYDTGCKMLDDGLDIPVPLEHQELAYPVDEESRKADSVLNNAGWVDSYEMDGDTLWAILEINDPQAVEKIVTDTVRYVSPKIEPEFRAGDGETYQQAIVHIALTPRPVYAGQEAFEPEEAEEVEDDEEEIEEAARDWNETPMSLSLSLGNRLAYTGSGWKPVDAECFGWERSPTKRTQNRWVGTGPQAGKTKYQKAEPGVRGEGKKAEKAAPAKPAAKAKSDEAEKIVEEIAKPKQARAKKDEFTPAKTEGQKLRLQPLQAVASAVKGSEGIHLTGPNITSAKRTFARWKNKAASADAFASKLQENIAADKKGISKAVEQGDTEKVFHHAQRLKAYGMMAKWADEEYHESLEKKRGGKIEAPGVPGTEEYESVHEKKAKEREYKLRLQEPRGDRIKQIARNEQRHGGVLRQTGAQVFAGHVADGIIQTGKAKLPELDRSLKATGITPLNMYRAAVNGGKYTDKSQVIGKDKEGNDVFRTIHFPEDKDRGSYISDIRRGVLKSAAGGKVDQESLRSVLADQTEANRGTLSPEEFFDMIHPKKRAGEGIAASLAKGKKMSTSLAIAMSLGHATLAWQSAKTKKGGIKAYDPATKRSLYGKRAESALKKQKAGGAAKRGGKTMQAPAKKVQRDAKTEKDYLHIDDPSRPAERIEANPFWAQHAAGRRKISDTLYGKSWSMLEEGLDTPPSRAKLIGMAFQKSFSRSTA